MSIFLTKVKVKQFSNGVKKHGVPPFGKRQYRSGYRCLVKSENKNIDEIYTVVGQTSIQEGYTEHNGEEGMQFIFIKSHTVYIVAKSIGRRFKVLLEDLEFINYLPQAIETNESPRT